MGKSSMFEGSSMAWWKGTAKVQQIWVQIPVRWVTSCVNSDGFPTFLSKLFLFQTLAVVLLSRVLREWIEVIYIKCIVSDSHSWSHCLKRERGPLIRYIFSVCLSKTVYRNLTTGGEHTIQYMYDLLLDCTLETYWISLTNATIKKK